MSNVMLKYSRNLRQFELMTDLPFRRLLDSVFHVRSMIQPSSK